MIKKLLASGLLLGLQTIASAAYPADNATPSGNTGSSWTEPAAPSQAPAIVLVPAPNKPGSPAPAASAKPKPQPSKVPQATPTSPQPAAAPPAPPAQPTPPVQATPAQPPAQAAPAHFAQPQPASQGSESAEGQWIYSDQYGWIWTPYGQAYTYVNPAGSAAYEYVYYPTFGWRWVYAPWVFGWGPTPYWGFYGPGRFAW